MSKIKGGVNASRNTGLMCGIHCAVILHQQLLTKTHLILARLYRTHSHQAFITTHVCDDHPQELLIFNVKINQPTHYFNRSSFIRAARVMDYPLQTPTTAPWMGIYGYFWIS